MRAVISIYKKMIDKTYYKKINFILFWVKLLFSIINKKKNGEEVKNVVTG